MEQTRFSLEQDQNLSLGKVLNGLCEAGKSPCYSSTFIKAKSFFLFFLTLITRGIYTCILRVGFPDDYFFHQICFIFGMGPESVFV